MVVDPIVRHSGLQKQVLSLYRRALQTARSKADANGSMETVREAFRQHKDINRSDFRLIEFLLRQGERKVKMLSNAASVGIRSATRVQ